MAETQWMTLTETADMMKTLPDEVTQMCEDGKLEYYMEDGRYFVSRESIDLFMHPAIGEPAPANPDSNGTPRRQYGRAPQETEPSPESATEAEAVLDAEDLAETEVVETVDDANQFSESQPGESADPEPSIGDEQLEVAAMDPGETGESDVRAVEILADLRAALARHAAAHQAFCDEIAGLADALESTLTRDDDKTSELTREISSLLARYTRR